MDGAVVLWTRARAKNRRTATMHTHWHAARRLRCSRRPLRQRLAMLHTASDGLSRRWQVQNSKRAGAAPNVTLGQFCGRMKLEWSLCPLLGKRAAVRLASLLNKVSAAITCLT